MVLVTGPTVASVATVGYARFRSGLQHVPDHVDSLVLGQDDLGRVLFVDVADEAVVHGVADELLEATGEGFDEGGRYAELLVLLLADVARAVVHGDTDTTAVGPVGASAVPEASHPDE